jgi:perosamine synthetase
MIKKINLQPYNSYGKEEELAALKVIRSRKLSDFLARPGKNFKGGKNVKKFEQQCQKIFKTKYAIAVNSWTSGLIAAAGAIDLNPGDEVIVTPNTMSATISSILHWGAIPVFCDVEDKFFNIDHKKITKLISKKTKAIFVVDIYGHPCNYKEIFSIAKKNKLYVVSDNAQSPGAYYNKKLSSSISDIGGISLNYHKHIHTGEGGVIFTNDKNLYYRCCLIRNHAEAIIASDNKIKNYSNLVGHNFRFGEIEAALGLVQLKKLKKKVARRQYIANYLNKNLRKYEWLRLPKVEKNCTHSYYIYPIVLDTQKVKGERDFIINQFKKINIEGITRGYLPSNLLPVFLKKIAFGKKNYPWSMNKNKKYIYKKGTCPIAEDLYFNSLICFEMCRFQLDNNDLIKFTKVFTKILDLVDFKYKKNKKIS